jgi:hypothetical protein
MDVVYSCMGREVPTGFSAYLLRTYNPRCPEGQALIKRLQTDARFPRHIQSRESIRFYIRQRVLRWQDRRQLYRAWACYVQWKRAQERQLAA